MSSIKVTIAQTDGSYFISSANNDLPTNFDFNPEFSRFEWGGASYQISNYKVDPNEPVVNWISGIEMAYRFISLYPNETGYPDLGEEVSINGDYAPYLTLDGQKSVAPIVEKLTLSDTAVADFSLIYSWSVGAASLATDAFKALVTELNAVRDQVQTEASQFETDCINAVANGNTFTWPQVVDSNGNVVFAAVTCDSNACCAATRDSYTLAKIKVESAPIFASIDVSAETITKKHIYKFVESGGN